MAAEFELSETIDTTRDNAISYFLNVEDIPKYHPQMARNVEVLEKSDSAIKYKLEGKVLLKKIQSVNKMAVDREKGELVTETLEGDGKGSVVTMNFQETGGRTEIKLKATMELGALGALGKGKVASMWKEALQQAKQILEKK